MKECAKNNLPVYGALFFVFILIVLTSFIIFTNFLDIDSSYSGINAISPIKSADGNKIANIANAAGTEAAEKTAESSGKDPETKTRLVAGAEVSSNMTLKKQSKQEYLSAIKTPTTGKVHKELKEEIKRKKPEEKVNVIIEVNDEEKLSQISNIIEENGGNVYGEFEVGDSIIAAIPSEKVQELAGNNEIQGLWPDREYSMLLDTSIDQINANAAWNTGFNGAGIKIAVLDTGIDETNEMLAGKVIASGVFTGENHTQDKQGHGTHIAGIIAGNGKYKGAAPSALLMNAKVLTDQGSGSTSTIIKGINWAVENGADIISMSIGGPYNDPDGPVNIALKDAIDKGVIAVISSGNCGEGCPSGSCGSFRGVTNPSDFEEAITVGAVDKGNNWACFSSGQEFADYIKPDLVAPGVNITSSYLGNNYQAMSGTSMSAPFVAGVAALMLHANSNLTQVEVKQILEENALDLGINGKDAKYGSGLVDVSRLFLLQSNETEPKAELNGTNLTEVNETDEVNETEIANKTAPGLLIEQDIGENWFIEKSEFTEPEHGFYGEMAKYQNKEIYKISVGVLAFENESFQKDFLDQNIAYTHKLPISSQELYFTQNDEYWFWISENNFIWVLASINVTGEMQPIFEEYLLKYNVIAQYGIKQTNPGEIEIHESNDALEINDTLNATYSANAYCTDSCDRDSYKTDLSSGACHNSINYEKKGTTYNDERRWTYTDYCVDSSTLREYFLKCNYYSWGWCSTQGWFCNMDETFQTDKNCASTFGSGYTCSNGACVASCDYSPSCSYSAKRECYSPTSYTKYSASTACNGGCQENNAGSFGCGSGNYCSGTAYDSLPCYSCSTASDRQCQSSACYGTDPDCKSDGSVYECTLDSHCSSDKKCVNKQCVEKTCEEMGYSKGSCSWLDDWGSDGQCLDGSNGDVYKCQSAGSKNCWSRTIDCSSNEFCDDPTFSPAQCFPYPCTVSSSSWSTTSAMEGDKVTLTANADSYCSGKTAKFEIWESDCPSFDPSSLNATNNAIEELNVVNLTVQELNNTNTTGNLSSQDLKDICSHLVETISNIGYSTNKFETAWTAKYESDIIGLPDYYFNVIVDGSELSSSSNILKVMRCGDGICSNGENCPKDCLKIDSFYQLPSSVGEDDDVQINVVIKNIGTVAQTGKVEAAIIPVNFFSQDYLPQGSSRDITGCCEANKYYDTREVTREAGDNQYTTFNIKVPTKFSVDECDNDGSKRSAWGSSFIALAGAYDLCYKDGGTGYYSYIEQNINVKEKYSYIDLVSYELLPPNPTVLQGGSFKFRYKISNSWQSSVKVILGASLRDTNNKEYNDVPNDIVISALPGTYWYERTFSTDSSYITGSYDAAWGIHKVDANNNAAGGIEFSSPYWAENLIQVTGCGDNVCSSGETSSSCPNDCYAQIEIESISDITPSTAVAGKEVSFTAKVVNKGTIYGERFIEGAVVPESWKGIIYPLEYMPLSYIDNPLVCPGNTYYDSKKVSLAPNGIDFVKFSVKAPNQTSVDACDANSPKRSAWDSLFRIIAGTYANIEGGGYESFKYVPYNIYECSSKGDCPNGGYVGQRYCDGNNVNQNFEFGTCALNACGFGIAPKIVEFCSYTCSVVNGAAQCIQPSGFCDRMPDGSSWYCQCKSNVECRAYGDYFCNQVSGPNPCEPVLHNDECSNYNDYFCEDGNVKHCFNNGKYWEKQLIETCSGKYQYCDPSVVDGTWKCSKYPKNFDVWLDYADTGVAVNKQPGDKLKLNIYSFDATTLQVYYDTNFIEGNCNGIFNVAPGINTCELTVKDNIEDATQYINIEGKIIRVNIINDPQLLVVTDSEKLTQQFQFESNGVRAVLKQAYANAKDSGVVYDLSWYKNELGVNNPFISFISYFEKITKPNMVDNSYSIEVSNFIKNKCENCKDVMIVGDDFVVPQYRNEVPLTQGFSAWGIVDWFEDRISKPIYTDTGFIQRKFDFKISDLKEMENRVYFVLPSNMNSELRDSISELELTIKNKFDVKVNEIQGNEVNCDDVQYFDKFNDASLFIIGDRENNPSLKCYPFIDLEENMVTVQPNIWDSAHLFDDSKSFTVIINSLNPNVTMNVDYLFKNDIYLDINERSAILDYALMGAGAVGAGAVIIGAVTIGSPVLIVGGVILAGTSIANECIIKNAGGDNWGWCGLDAGLTVVGGKVVELGFKASKPLVTWTVKNTVGTEGIKLLSKYGDDFLSASYELIKKGKYKSFVKALNDGRHYADDIFNFFRKNIVRFDDVVAKQANDIDGLLPKLSKDARRVFDDSIAPTTAKASEAVSFENFAKRGAILKNTEKELGDGIDYAIELGVEKVGVSVKRIQSQTPRVENVRDIISAAEADLIKAKKLVDSPKKWDGNVVHILVRSDSDAELVERAYKLALGTPGSISDEKNLKVLISRIENYLMGD